MPGRPPWAGRPLAAVTVADVGDGYLVADVDVLGRVVSVTLNRRRGAGTLTAIVRDENGVIVRSLLVSATALVPGAVVIPVNRQPLIDNLAVSLAYGRD